MSVMDFNTAEKQTSSDFELIPAKTIAPVRLNLRGNKKFSTCYMLDCEFTILEGPYAKRKIWQNMMTQGNGSDGHNKAIDIMRSNVRGMIESAYGIDPTDDGEMAMEARKLEDWDDLDGLEFVASIGIEKSKDPNYSDKNNLRPVTPDSKDYVGFKPATVGRKAAQSAQQANGSSRPAWG